MCLNIRTVRSVFSIGYYSGKISVEVSTVTYNVTILQIIFNTETIFFKKPVFLPFVIKFVP